MKPAFCRIISFASGRRAECTRDTTNYYLNHRLFTCLLDEIIQESFFALLKDGTVLFLPMIGNPELPRMKVLVSLFDGDTIPYIVRCLAMPMP